MRGICPKRRSSKGSLETVGVGDESRTRVAPPLDMTSTLVGKHGGDSCMGGISLVSISLKGSSFSNSILIKAEHTWGS